MISMVKTTLLKPHPKNSEYYNDITGEKYEEIKRSIEVHGIRDPLKVLPDYTIISGHQRWRIAKELGIEHVPVIILDIPPEEAEYLLIAENEERRNDSNDDPMKKARRAKFLKEYWKVKRGNTNKNLLGQNVLINERKTLQDIAEAIGEDVKTTQRLLKLNELIPELQSLVSTGKLGTTAAEELAYLSQDTQRKLYELLGKQITELKVSEIQQLRKETQLKEKEIQEKERQLAELQKQIEQLKTQKAQPSQEMRQALKLLQEKVEELQAEIESKENSLKKAWKEKQDAIRAKEEAERKAREAEFELQRLKQVYETSGISQEQCSLADKISELLINTTKELAGYLELLNVKALTKEKSLSLSAIVAKLQALLSGLYEELDKVDKGNITFLKR